MNDVSFKGCTLVVLDGAVAELDHVDFHCGGQQGSSVGVFAQGSGATVMARNCEIRGGLQGVALSKGAQMWALNLACSDAEVSGVEAQGADTRLYLSSCRISDMSKKFQNAHTSPNDEGKVDTFCAGIALRNQSAGYIIDTTVSKAENGLHAQYGAQAQIEGSTFSECVGSGANVSNNSTATFENCWMQSMQFFHGLEVDGAGTKARARHCTFRNSNQAGAAVFGGAFLEVSNSVAEKNEVSGYWAQGGAQLSITDSSSKGDGTGCGGCGDKSRIQATGVTVRDSVRSGFDIFAGAKAELSECRITNCAWSCVLVSAGASIIAKGCRMNRARQHDGIQVAGADTYGEVEDCSFVQNEQCGAGVFQGAKLTLKNCSSESNEAVGFCVQGGGELLLEDCTSERDSAGCGAHSDGKLVARGVKVYKSIGNGVTVVRDASADLSRCVIAGCGGNCIVAHEGAQVIVKLSRIMRSQSMHGVGVFDPGSHVTAEFCTLNDNKQAGAAGVQGGTLVMRGCNSRGNGVAGFWAQSGGHVLLTDCSSNGDDTGCCASGDGAQLKMFGGWVGSSSKVGVNVQDGAAVALGGVQTLWNSECGFNCTGLGSSMHLTCCVSLDVLPYRQGEGGLLSCNQCSPEAEFLIFGR